MHLLSTVLYKVLLCMATFFSENKRHICIYSYKKKTSNGKSCDYVVSLDFRLIICTIRPLNSKGLSNSDSVTLT